MTNVLHRNLIGPKNMLASICETYGHKLTYSQARDALNNLIPFISFPSLDNTLEIDGAKYRFIGEAVIEQIFGAEVQARIEQTFDVTSLANPATLPSWLASHVVIDWESVIKACRNDGYASEFGPFDGLELFETGIFMFRTE